jgi:ribonuclease D
MIAAIDAAQPISADDMPARADRKPGLTKDGALVADLLKLLLKIRAKEINVAARLLGRSDDLEALAAGQRSGLAILNSWRYNQFGRDALELVEGRLAFAVKDGKLHMARTAAEPSIDESPANLDLPPAS